MDNLRVFIDSRARKLPPAKSGNEAWERLTSKLDSLKRIKTLDSIQISDHEKIKTLQDVTGTKTMYVDSTVNLCIETLFKASNGQPSATFLDPDTRPMTDAAVAALNYLDSEGLLDKQRLIKILLEKKVVLPLELVWQLHKTEILPISTYIFNTIGPGNEAILSEVVLSLLTRAKKEQKNLKIATDVFESLLLASHSKLNFKLSAFCDSSLKKCIEDIANWVPNQPYGSDESEYSIDVSYLTSSKLRSACGTEVMNGFVLAHLLHILNVETTLFSTEALLYAVEIQEKTTIDSATQPLQDLLLHVVKALGGQEVVYQLGAAVVKPLVNWKIIFLLTGALVKVFPECCDDMTRLTDELIQLGLEGGKQNELSAGFLLARHCCSCDNKNFSTYSSWFSSHFGADSATARNTIQFQSLMKLLTDIVPAESVDILRIHLNKVPQAPTWCNSVLHDYCALARTRLADFNETSELAGLFSDSRQDSIRGLNHRQGDIVRVLQHFQQTQEINKAVLEASIFRQQYFKSVFLLELLNLPGSSHEAFAPEQFGLDQEIRHEFILALRSIGKIPDKLFKTYTDQRANQKLKESESEKAVIKKMKSASSVLEKTDEKNIDEAKFGPTDAPKKKKSLTMKPKRQL